MFNAQKYFEQVERRLLSCGASILEDTRYVAPSGDWVNWEVITWKAKLEWPGGEVFDVGDYWDRRTRKAKVMHTFSYHFMSNDGSCIFRLDSHGEKIPLDAACHIHLGKEERVIEADDQELCTYSLSGVTFLEAFSLAHRHLKGRKMPWEAT